MLPDLTKALQSIVDQHHATADAFTRETVAIHYDGLLLSYTEDHLRRSLGTPEFMVAVADLLLTSIAANQRRASADLGPGPSGGQTRIGGSA